MWESDDNTTNNIAYILLDSNEHGLPYPKVGFGGSMQYLSLECSQEKPNNWVINLNFTPAGTAYNFAENEVITNWSYASSQPADFIILNQDGSQTNLKAFIDEAPSTEAFDYETLQKISNASELIINSPIENITVSTNNLSNIIENMPNNICSEN